MPRLSCAALLVFSVLLLGCGGHTGSPAPRGGRITVINHAPVTAQVWVVLDTVHRRLGKVDSAGTAVLDIPAMYLARDSVGFLAFRDDITCAQKRREAVGRRRRFTMVLEPRFVVATDTVSKVCEWK